METTIVVNKPNSDGNVFFADEERHISEASFIVVHPPHICGNCKHWGVSRGWTEEGEHKTCGVLKDTYDFKKEIESEMAYTIAHEESALMTKSGFGCVLWEAKESEGEGA